MNTTEAQQQWEADAYHENSSIQTEQATKLDKAPSRQQADVGKATSRH